MRKQSKKELPKLKRKADRLLQDYYRLYCRNRNIKCMGCGGDMKLGHHFFEKSSSAGLRYEVKNLCPLCSSCHARHHLGGDPSIVTNILYKKGKKWYNSLRKLKVERKEVSLNKTFLLKQIDKWKKKIEQEKPTPDESVL